jgi:hypothetical protein
MSNLRRRHILLPFIAGILTPSLVIFILEVFVGYISPVQSVQSILKRQFAEGHNLFEIMLIGLIPFAVLIGITIVKSRRIMVRQLDFLSFGGLIGILSLMVAGHVAVWYPLYGGGHMSSTGVIAFFVIPFYCIVAMGIGMLFGLVIYRLTIGKYQNKDD